MTNTFRSYKYKTIYTYDPEGKLIEMRIVDITDKANGLLVEKNVYTYDAHGNWIKKIWSQEVTKFGKSSFEPVEVVYRTITYFGGSDNAIEK
jgi:hypothetical protein